LRSALPFDTFAVPSGVEGHLELLSNLGETGFFNPLLYGYSIGRVLRRNRETPGQPQSVRGKGTASDGVTRGVGDA
jgi:hypothetical protein